MQNIQTFLQSIHIQLTRNQSKTCARYQNTQNTTTYSMENLNNGKCLHFAYLINQLINRFGDTLDFFPLKV